MRANEKIYNMITEKFIAGLKKGRIPWRKNWAGLKPMNYFSKREYNGVNLMLLGMTEFESPYWMTFKQVRKMKGKVKKGSSGEQVIFWKIYAKEVEADNGETEEKKIFLLRYYTVFNAEQIEGIEFPKMEKPEATETNAKAEEIWNGYSDKPELKHGGDVASYNPAKDLIKMPNMADFETSDSYYHTLFHEAIHSTGHKDRLDRELKGIYSKKSYSFEELIAEIGACFLTSEAGIEPDMDNSQAYINGWISYLEGEKPNKIVSASSKARKAVEFIIPDDETE